MYAAMKRGDVEDLDERHMVDFDRKWAEAEERGEASKFYDTSSGEEDDASEDEEMVEYIDEFGRTRRGTRAEAARSERIQNAKAAGADAADRFTARPSAPSNIIYGDLIQHSAFNPDEPVAQQMAELAAKRDKSLTPPPETHFDARKEIRQKGQGFFQFSADEEERKRQMAELERERMETEQRRKENQDRKEKRRREVEERKRTILKKRGQKQADRFMENLMSELNGSVQAPVPKDSPEPDDQPAQDEAHHEVPNAGSELRQKLDRINDEGED